MALQCVALERYGCFELADCCAGSGCQRDTARDSGGTCVSVRARPKRQTGHPGMPCMLSALLDMGVRVSHNSAVDS